LAVEFQLFGQKKGRADVVPPPRALVVANEGVVWIDTIDFKTEQAAALGPEAPADERAAERARRAPSVTDALVDQALGALGQALPLAIDHVPLLKDGVDIELPRALAVLAPTFALQVGGSTFRADVNEIRGDSIHLAFKGVGDLDAHPEDVRLEISSLL